MALIVPWVACPQSIVGRAGRRGGRGEYDSCPLYHRARQSSLHARGVLSVVPSRQSTANIDARDGEVGTGWPPQLPCVSLLHKNYTAVEGKTSGQTGVKTVRPCPMRIAEADAHERWTQGRTALELAEAKRWKACVGECRRLGRCVLLARPP
jgi:hypothetical protein